MKSKTITTKFFFALISVWFAIAVLSISYNCVKAIQEVRVWGGLSDTQKRQKIFGDTYDFTNFLKNETQGKQFLVFSKDPMVYYLGRYSLYPQEIYWSEDDKISENLISSKKFTYIASYNQRYPDEGYELVATFSAKSGNYGFLYHKK